MFSTFAFCCCCLVGVFAHTDAEKSVMEGDSVSLNSGLTEIQEGDVITWTFGSNKTLIAKTTGVKNTIPDNLDGRFRDRLKLDNKTGSLTIMNITTEHTGDYEVKISRSSSSPSYRFTVTVYGPSSGPSSGSPSGPSSGPTPGPVSQTALISAAAAAAAGGFLLIVAVVGIICISKKHRKTDQEVETRDEEITYADPTFYKRNTQKSEDEVIYAGVVTRR